MSEDITKEAMSAVKELREVFEAKSAENAKSYDEKLAALSGEAQEKAAKINAVLDAQEEKNQKLVLELEEAKKAVKEQEERFETLEKAVVMKSTSGDQDYKESLEYKAFNELVQKGEASKISMEHKDYLRTDVGEFGGFLVPEMLSGDLLKQITEISPVRSLARVRSTQTKTLNIPIRTSLPTALFEGEAEAASTSTSKYISETMTAHRQHTIVPITRDQLNFAGFNMSSEISSDAVTAFAQAEGNKFLLGTGVKQPQGILDSSAGVATFDTAASATLTNEDLIVLASQLKEGYDGVFGFNKKVLAQLRIEKGANGQPVWRAGYESQPNEINGDRYIIMQDLPDIAVGAKSVVYGDFFKGYTILDALQMELIRDDVTRKDQAIVEFSWNRYLDGRVVLSEAFVIQTIKA